MFEIKERVEVNASRATIWSTLVDVQGWSTWDYDVVESLMQTPFQVGGSGYLIDVEGSRSAFTITALQEGVSYSNRYDFGAGSVLDFKHTIYNDAPPYVVIFQANFSGPLAIYRFIKSQRAVRSTMHNALQHLSQMLEGDVVGEPRSQSE
jgi:hypothetical protein